jgi:hypothetical protein
MYTKNLFTALVSLLLLCGTGHALQAQSTLQEEAQMIEQIFGKAKKALVEQYMDFAPGEADAFWPVYEEYAEKSRELTAERIRVLDRYAQNYGSFSNEDADAMVKSVLGNQKATAKLQQKLYKKLSKAINPVRAAQFLQMERYLQSSIWQSINEEIPFIGELDGGK